MSKTIVVDEARMKLIRDLIGRDILTKSDRILKNLLLESLDTPENSGKNRILEFTYALRDWFETIAETEVLTEAEQRFFNEVQVFIAYHRKGMKSEKERGSDERNKRVG